MILPPSSKNLAAERHEMPAPVSSNALQTTEVFLSASADKNTLVVCRARLTPRVLIATESAISYEKMSISVERAFTFGPPGFGQM